MRRRSIAGTLRDPANIGPALFVPLSSTPIIAGGLGDITKIKGFPTDSITTWAWTILFAQGAMMTDRTTGTAIATDISTGFINRLALTPAARHGPRLAQLVGDSCSAYPVGRLPRQSAYLTGARISAGIPGAVAS